ncbi:MAG TPA: NADH-quinone oxidoreductase subunit N [Syntrophales bacterium]|nr:NADH-quinone oxidoreductase subunit N [Syntrophales bacterium]
MTALEIKAILPFMVLAAAQVAIILGIALRRSHRLTFALAIGAVIAAVLAVLLGPAPSPHSLTPLLVVDGYAVFFIVLILLSGLFTFLISYGYLEARRENREEFYVLILTALLGSIVLVASTHLASFLLGLESLSVSLYALAAYARTSELSFEAGIKYLVLAAFSSAFLIFGMALTYAEVGSMEFTAIAAKAATPGMGPVFLAGMMLIIVGIGFKLAVVPFHMWIADVYEGAPAPVVGFIATVSKGAVSAVLLRYFMQVDAYGGNSLTLFFVCIAVASMFVGNLLALFQDNLKRLLAYSSIAHMGYLFVAFLASGGLRVTAVVFYLTAYFIVNLGAFGVVTILSGKERDADRLDDYLGLFFENPWIAGVLTVMLLSLAGIPLTAGFIGKFYVLAAGIDSVLWFPVICLIVTSAIGLFYYLRVLIVLFTPAPENAAAVKHTLSAGAFALALPVFLLVGLGVYPGPVLTMIINLAAR